MVSTSTYWEGDAPQLPRDRSSCTRDPRTSPCVPHLAVHLCPFPYNTGSMEVSASLSSGSSSSRWLRGPPMCSQVRQKLQVTGVRSRGSLVGPSPHPVGSELVSELNCTVGHPAAVGGLLGEEGGRTSAVRSALCVRRGEMGRVHFRVGAFLFLKVC